MIGCYSVVLNEHAFFKNNQNYKKDQPKQMPKTDQKKQRLLLTCAPISKLPSKISTFNARSTVCP